MSTIADLPVETLTRWREKPGVMVRELFKATPDPWQDEVLEAFPHNPRLAMKASKGPGKTCTIAWLCWNFLLTRLHPNIAATSVSGDNLRDGLWKEMAVWQNKSALLKQMFMLGTRAIAARGHERTWFMSARTWPKTANEQELGNTLAGLHAPYMLFVIDEAGGVPVAILQAADAGLANAMAGMDGAKEAHVVIAGNTNMLEGALYLACVKQAKLWRVTTITGDPDDPMRSSRISIEWARQLIEVNGRDDPFVKVMVLGEWPSSSVNALLGPDDIERAMNRCYREYQYGHASKVMGVDVARDGSAASVLTKRQGLVVLPQRVWRNVTSIQGAGAVAREWNEWEADACFVDMTGGFGAGWYDNLKQLGKTPLGVTYSASANDKGRYYNKRAEMYFLAAEWIKGVDGVGGGQLPPHPELTAALTQTCYTFKGDRLLLEPKETIQAKIGYSPDHADSFVQTFAEPVSPKRPQIGGQKSQVLGSYDPFDKVYEVSER